MVLRAIERDTPKNNERIPITVYQGSGPVGLVAKSLVEWSETCPGAGWEHHNMRALQSLVQTPSMSRLLSLARTGLLAEERERLRAEGAQKQEPDYSTMKEASE